MWAYQGLALLAVAMAVSKSIEEWRRSAVQQEEAKASPTTDTDPWGRSVQVTIGCASCRSGCVMVDVGARQPKSHRKQGPALWLISRCVATTMRPSQASGAADSFVSPGV